MSIGQNRCDRAVSPRQPSLISSSHESPVAVQYEDRGTVDDKGDVQITRKYLQSKKTTAPVVPPTQSDAARGRKQISPICPPSGGQTDGGQPVAKPANRGCHATRYSNMLTMSAMEEPGGDKKPQMVLMDINDNVQPLDEYYTFQDKVQRKKDADGFPNFDMWNSVLPSLSNSPTSPGSPRAYDEGLLPDEGPSKPSPPREWENGTVHPLSQLSLFNPGDSGVSNCHSYYNLLTGKMVEQTRPVAAVRYQNYPCYVLLQPPAYLCSKDVVAYPQSSSVPRDGYDCRSYGRNEQIGVQGPADPILAGDFWHGGLLTKAAGNAVSRSVKSAAPNYSPSVVLNFTPIGMPAENATSCCLPADVANDERRPRPILKQEAAQL